jgi:hypothetical protein
MVQFSLFVIEGVAHRMLLENRNKQDGIWKQCQFSLAFDADGNKNQN